MNKTTATTARTRAEAKALGLSHFTTGKPCKRGNIAPRLARNGECTCEACVRASNESKRKWQAENNPPKGRFIHPDEESRKAAVKLSNAKWRKSNPDKVKELKKRSEAKNFEVARAGAARRNQRYAKRNRKKISNSLKLWRKQNPDLARVHVMDRRARKLHATPPWFGEFDELVMREAAALAELREKATGFCWHVDHMIPLQAGDACGLHCAQNVQVIPASLNVRKNNKMIFTEPCEWLRAV